jgi:hypothetical protein
MKGVVAVAICAVWLATVAPASAHHSFAVYDLETDIELVGVVGTLKFRNPHLAMTLITSAGNGTEERVYTLEGAPANMLVRLGLKPSFIEPGTKIKVIAAPPRGDGDVYLVKAIILEDGTKFQALD